MKRELKIAKCDLACCLCSENKNCQGCDSLQCLDQEKCENRKCTLEKGLSHCYRCEKDCKKGLLSEIKPYGFTLFARRYKEEAFLNYLKRNEENGIVYHRQGLIGDYDEFDDAEKLIAFIKDGKEQV